MPLNMIPISSSRITEMGYDADEAIVYVRFTDGPAWQYKYVPENIWLDFVSADSKGRFINQVLNHYEHGPAGI